MGVILSRGRWVNSVWPNDATWLDRSWSTVFDAIVSLVDDAKPLPQPMLTKNAILFQANAFEIVACSMAWFAQVSMC